MSRKRVQIPVPHFHARGIPLVKVKLSEDSCRVPSLEDVLTCIEVGEAFTSTTEMAPMAQMERAHRCFARHFQLCLKLAIFLVVRQSIAFDDLDMVPWRPWRQHTATIVCQHTFMMFHRWCYQCYQCYLFLTFSQARLHTSPCHEDVSWRCPLKSRSPT